ncbi:MAG: hypothetical protein ACP6IY_04840 [Promethearchaeia archaeon]
MLYQGIFNIIDLYLSDSIDVFYNNLDNYLKKNISECLSCQILSEKELDQKYDNFLQVIINNLIKLGFSNKELEYVFPDNISELKDISTWKVITLEQLYNKKIAPIIYEIFLKRLIDYIVDSNGVITKKLIHLKDKEILPLELIIGLREIKDLFKKEPDKINNLKKYLILREKIIEKFKENKDKIEKLENLKYSHTKLQLLYLIFRIIEFFHIQRSFDFTQLKNYLKNNLDEWLDTIPLVSLKNPEIYFCGIYLSNRLDVPINENKIIDFLNQVYEELVDEFEAPIIEATDQIYYFFKSTSLLNYWLPENKIIKLTEADAKFFESNYLKDLETSQLVVILKIYNLVNLINKVEDFKIKAVIKELETRITPEGIKQFRDGYNSSEATYYVLFCGYMRRSLQNLKDYNLLENIITRIYRNLELLDFSSETNYDLISEIFYSFECLKLLNCIETKEMIIHLAKYLFPEPIKEKIMKSEKIGRGNARFRHLKVNRITGETMY